MKDHTKAHTGFWIHHRGEDEGPRYRVRFSFAGETDFDDLEAAQRAAMEIEQAVTVALAKSMAAQEANDK